MLSTWSSVKFCCVLKDNIKLGKKRDNAGSQHFPLFPQSSPFLQTNTIISTTFYLLSVYSLPNIKILDLTKFMAFADEKINIVQMMISICDSVEDIVAKGKKCWLPAFSPFPLMFSSLTVRC